MACSDRVVTTVALPYALGPAPTIDAAAVHLGLSVHDLDPVFGVVAIDPGQRLFAILLPASKVPKGAQAYSDPAIGPLD